MCIRDRARTRFSKFFNLPELMNLFKEIADIKTADQDVYKRQVPWGAGASISGCF